MNTKGILRQGFLLSLAGIALLTGGCYESSSTSQSTGSSTQNGPATAQAKVAGLVSEIQSYQARMAHDPTSHLTTFIGADPAAPLPIDNQAFVAGLTGGAPASPGFAAVRKYGALFGLSAPDQELQEVRRSARPAGGSVTRYQQVVGGIPVIGGELMVNTSARGLLSMGGEISPDLKLSTTPDLTATAAEGIAQAAISKWHNLAADQLKVSPARLAIYDPRLIGPEQALPIRLVWQVEVDAKNYSLPLREMVLVDAKNGSIALHFNQNEGALDRATYTSNHTETLPGTLVCDESDPTCQKGDLDAQDAHRYTADFYNFFARVHGRDSLDNHGMKLVSSVHYGSGDMQNAYWNGEQMVYTDGMSRADDVVAHELTHGFTQHTSGLSYYYQSGAINESLSDIWGEFIDQTNGAGNDSPAVKWLLGEDIPGTGAVRSMKDPTQFGQPDRMTSPLYGTDSGDQGEVHRNSGVNNKAAYLMVEGGNFNGQTIVGLGLIKVAKIYYELETHMLTSGSNYHDLYEDLYQGCMNLTTDSSTGISSDECQEVRKATLAVEMNREPIPGFLPQVDACPSPEQPVDLFFDNMENSQNWGFRTLSGSTNTWSFNDQFARSGRQSLASIDPAGIADSAAEMQRSIKLPAKAFLHFSQAYDFDSGGGGFYDGGVLEYSLDNGASWTDAGTLHDQGSDYGGTLASNSGNPLGGRRAFVGISHGYVQSRYDLSPLAGKSVRFRFRLGSDNQIAGWGWYVDDLRIYTCALPQSSPGATPVSQPTQPGPIQPTPPASQPTQPGPTQPNIGSNGSKPCNCGTDPQAPVSGNPPTQGSNPSAGAASAGGGGALDPWLLAMLLAALPAQAWRRRRTRGSAVPPWT